MRAYASGERHWFKRDKRVMRAVLDRIRAEGQLQANDFEAPHGKKSGPWFDWKPAKTALEQLFIEGTLMVRSRKGFQKVYDLAERVLPGTLNTTLPDEKEMARFLITSALRSHGLALESEMRYLRKGAQHAVRTQLSEMVHAGDVVGVHVENLPGEEFFCFPKVLESRPKSRSSLTGSVQLLSPFDNSVIQRQRINRLFNFDYQIECYVPAPKRKYGYFCLPLLADGRLIGRLDCKAERKEKTLRVHMVTFDPEFKKFDPESPELRKALARFAAFNGCDKVVMAPRRL